MTRFLSEDELRALGLDPARLGESVTLAWPEEGAAHGRGLTDTVIGVAAIIGLNYAGMHFGPASVPTAEALRIAVDQAEEDRRILKLSAPPDTPGEVRMLPPGEGAATPSLEPWARDPHDPATVLLDLRPWVSAGGLVLLPSGDGLLITVGPDGLKVTRIFAELSLAPLAEIGSPVASWLSAHHTPWLRQEIQARLDRADAWQHAVAVGLFARLATPSDRIAPDPRQEDLVRPRLWARSLGSAQVETLELLLEAEVERLLAATDDLAGTMACDDPHWRSELVELCRGRDDVEGVRILLNEAGAGEAVADPVELLDEAGSRLVRSLPVRLEVDDARLREVRSFDHDAWWVALARRQA